MNVTYAAHYPWNRSGSGAPATNRPYAEIVLKGPMGSPRIWCLVDSGADHIQVNRSFAKTAGIAATGSQTVSTAAGGTTTVDVASSVNFTVEGIATTQQCFFGNNSVPILGRVTFLNVFADVGFDATGWMRS
jgi:hypothetical protein